MLCRWRWTLSHMLAWSAAWLGCRPAAPTGVAPLFERLTPEASGIAFVNELPEDPEFNILNYLYYYNGGGVAVGDIDNDGLQDLYFSANLGANRLYRNLGNYRFEDVTDRAGVKGPEGWKTGVTMADANGDGHVDIYVSAVSYLTMQGRNVLYVNNGDGTFTDRTKEFGLEHVGFSTQALFFDYDCDGDLDMFLLNHSTHTERAVGSPTLRQLRHAKAGDRLFRNDGNVFVDVSERAGIYGGVDGFGLGVVASDLNVDGCPDLYIANDFQENDFLYLNNCDGTFSEVIGTATGHTSRFSMGVDAADFNNDGRPDLAVVDMLPAREDVLKTSATSESQALFDLRLRAGYHPQYARNTLQLNRGAAAAPSPSPSPSPSPAAPSARQHVRAVPRFSDIAYLAGVHATDWSWAALFADLDNDGYKDLFVTSGMYRRPNDLDYIEYVSNEAVQASLAAGITQDNLALVRHMPQAPLPNHAYRNNGDLTFTDMAQPWGLAEPGFSNGAVYVDLNNSGSLDLVVNRINAPAAIYRNRAREHNKYAFLTVELRGSGRNSAGIGARVIAVHGATMQWLEQMPTRGYQSSVDPRLHFGVGAASRIDSLIVVWPDRRYQVLRDLAVNRRIMVWQDSAGGRVTPGELLRVTSDTSLRFVDVTRQFGLDVRHVENAFLDYQREPLMPHLLSTEGPALAVGDVNGDQLDDLFVGGAKWQPGRLLVQQMDGTFREASARTLGADSLAEDVDAAFFDADGDGDLDLYVVSGGNEFWGDADALRDRLYLNDGRGEFHRAADALPVFYENGACVVPGDFDNDGDIDLFVGSRVVARAYGQIPRSYLLENDGRGRFTDVTAQRAPDLAFAGMVTGAAWFHADADSSLDLVVVGEWMAVRLFRQSNGRFIERSAEAGLMGTQGWWNSVTVADVNGDARNDLVLGNLGTNSYIRASASQPARLYVHDFGSTGSLKQVLTFYKGRVSYPLAGRDDFLRLLPALRPRYPTYAAFGASRLEDIFPAREVARATVREARVFATSVVLNTGQGTFRLEPLPNEAQFAPVFAALPSDLDGDGRLDLLVAGNHYGVQPLRGRYDASYGTVLRGLPDGRLTPVAREASQLAIDGQVRRIKQLRHASGSPLVVVARNNASLLFLRVER
ncbi:MAG: VCBS repeat-containing protein [Gemmatimonadaceae bacterium]